MGLGLSARELRAFAVGVCTPLGLFLAYQLSKAIRDRPRAHSKPHGNSGLKVVITGSARGLGFHMARKFVELGDDVVVTSRSQSHLDAAVRRLKEEFPGCKAVGFICDVTRPEDVERLAAQATEALGQIDVFVANAAQSARAKTPLFETSTTELQEIVGANLLGSLLGARAAVRQMLTQPEGGKVFLMDGSGSRGNPTPGNAAYGATKRALVQLKDTLAAEVASSNVSVHILSPGLVSTDLLLQYATTPRAAKFINILADKPSTVAAWLVPRIRGADRNGSYIKYLTPLSVAWKFLTARQRKGRFVPESGSAVAAGYQQLDPEDPAAEYEQLDARGAVAK